MTPEQLAAIKARAGIGTPTPEHDCAAQGYGCERCQSEADASAADVPALVAEVERLRGIEAAAYAYREDGYLGTDGMRHHTPEAYTDFDAAIRAAGSGE